MPSSSKTSTVTRFILPILFAILPGLAGMEGELPPAVDRKVDFEKEVRPLLSSRCFKCHSSKKQKGGLQLDLRATALKGGDSGAAIEPGKSAESRLVLMVAGKAKKRMPPSGKPLLPEQVGVLRAWIDQGATWPEDPAGSSRIESDHWSLQPVKKPAAPKVTNKDWVKNPIDAFVLEKLQEKELQPRPAADRRTLIRRLSFTLLGLPPSPQEVKTFVEDKNPEAYRNLVERLLASPLEQI